MLLHLFIIFNVGINAAPIYSNTSDNHNSTFNLKRNRIHPKGHRNQSSTSLNISSIIANIQVPKDFDLPKVAKDLKKFGIDHLRQEQHIEGLPLDRRGKRNPDFHKEIFLGNHELFEADIDHNKQTREKKLEEIFNEADQNHNKLLSREELLNYVVRNIQEHSDEAKTKNSQLFILIDSNENGKITWHEYAALYIQFHHMNESDIRNFDDVDFIKESFDENLQRELLKIRYRWTEADGGNDNELNHDEFLAFRHPEIASRTYKYIVDDIITQMDQDDDLKLKESEFVYALSPPLGNENDKELPDTDRRWLEQQETEFQEMDENKDGYLTRDELLNAYNPLNRAHINIQIKKLFSKVDDSPKDDSLSLSEVERHADVFADMRILDTIRTIHEEI